MKALKYTGLPKNAHMVIYDALDSAPEAGYFGSPITIYPDQIVPLEHYQNNENYGDVATDHVKRGLAEMIDLEEKATEREQPESREEPLEPAS